MFIFYKNEVEQLVEKSNSFMSRSCKIKGTNILWEWICKCILCKVVQKVVDKIVKTWIKVKILQE